MVHSKSLTTTPKLQTQAQHESELKCTALLRKGRQNVLKGAKVVFEDILQSSQEFERGKKRFPAVVHLPWIQKPVRSVRLMKISLMVSNCSSN